jgi:hypothetical protein
MTEVLTRVEFDCETQTETIVPLTEQEILEREAMAAQALADQIAQEEAAAALAALKASAKAKLIAGQPLTAEEADTLVL